MDAFRVSLSSAVSSSTQGSGNNDGDALRDVFIWGESTGDGILGGGKYIEMKVLLVLRLIL
jgi:hypothetical protein